MPGMPPVGRLANSGRPTRRTLAVMRNVHIAGWMSQPAGYRRARQPVTARRIGRRILRRRAPRGDARRRVTVAWNLLSPPVVVVTLAVGLLTVGLLASRRVNRDRLGRLMTLRGLVLLGRLMTLRGLVLLGGLVLRGLLLRGLVRLCLLVLWRGRRARTVATGGSGAASAGAGRGGSARYCRHRRRCTYWPSAHRTRGAEEVHAWHLAAEELTDLRQVRGDRVLLAGQFVDLALSRGTAPFGVGLDFGEELVGLCLCLRHDLVRVLLRVRDELASVRIRFATSLLGLRRRLRGTLLGGGGALLGFGHQLLGGRLRRREPLGFLALRFLAPGGELHLELGLGLSTLRFALLQDALRLAAHLVSLPLGRGEDLVPLALSGRLELRDFALGRGAELGDVALSGCPLFSDLMVGSRAQLGDLALGGGGQLVGLAPCAGADRVGFALGRAALVVSLPLGVSAQLGGFVLRSGPQFGGIYLSRGLDLVRLRSGRLH